MLGHYVAFITLINGLASFCIGAIGTKLNRTCLKHSNDILRNLYQTTGIPGMVPLLWISVKYQYHIPLELLILAFAMLMRPMTYFYVLICSGNRFNLAELVCCGMFCTTAFHQEPSLLIHGMKLNNGSGPY